MFTRKRFFLFLLLFIAGVVFYYYVPNQGKCIALAKECELLKWLGQALLYGSGVPFLPIPLKKG